MVGITLHSQRFLLWCLLVFFGLCIQSASAQASDWTFGLKGGFGGTGIVKSAVVEEATIDVSRSEGPLVGGISVEKILNQKWSLSIEHRRGFRLGPFSSGVGFTDVTWRWYFYGDPAKIIATSLKNSVFQQSWSGFIGPSTGLAFGTISREGDLVETISSSGFTMGVKTGMDYHYMSGLIIRPELIVSTTILSEGAVAASMSEFALVLGLVFPLSIF